MVGGSIHYPEGQIETDFEGHICLWNMPPRLRCHLHTVESSSSFRSELSAGQLWDPYHTSRGFSVANKQAQSPEA